MSFSFMPDPATLDLEGALNKIAKCSSSKARDMESMVDASFDRMSEKHNAFRELHKNLRASDILHPPKLSLNNFGDFSLKK